MNDTKKEIEEFYKKNVVGKYKLCKCEYCLMDCN